ncbi:MAG: hypothetical protein U5R49_07340 [Deltaproteobacteria bacterium]|nr:hypothetical protein [Deltaproteobacteria bacterium]
MIGILFKPFLYLYRSMDWVAINNEKDFLLALAHQPFQKFLFSVSTNKTAASFVLGDDQ